MTSKREGKRSLYSLVKEKINASQNPIQCCQNPTAKDYAESERVEHKMLSRILKVYKVRQHQNSIEILHYEPKGPSEDEGN